MIQYLIMAGIIVILCIQLKIFPVRARNDGYSSDDDYYPTVRRDMEPPIDDPVVEDSFEQQILKDLEGYDDDM